MPYFISNSAKGCSGWATVKANGEVLGCHKTKTQAIAQMIALSLAEDIKPGGNIDKDDKRIDSGPQAVIVDIDGTLIQNGRRVEKVYNFLDDMKDTAIFIVTGRNTSDRDSTIAQLDELSIDYNRLFMNPGSSAETAEFKKATAEKLLKEYNIILAIDNNSTMRKVYRDLGITALNVPDVPNVPSDEGNVDEEDSSTRQVSLTPPAYMRAAARRGLELNREGAGGDGLKQKTIREARNMAAGQVTEDKWRRIGPWIARHLVDLDAPKNSDTSHPQYPGPGLTAHLLWGSGPSKARAIAAMNYAMNLVEKLDENKRHLPGQHDQLTHGSGGGSGGYVKGRNLLDKDIQRGNALDESITKKSSNWSMDDFAADRFTEDKGLEEIAEMQGFTGKPTVAKSQKEYDDLPSASVEQASELAGIQIGELHRGTKDSANISGKKAKEEFVSGDYWAGKGAEGNGIYSADDKEFTLKYADGNPENITSFKLRPDAKITSTKDLREKYLDANSADILLPTSVDNDAGRFAAALGYDAVYIDGLSVNAVIVLNRTAVVLPPGANQ